MLAANRNRRVRMGRTEDNGGQRMFVVFVRKHGQLIGGKLAGVVQPAENVDGVVAVNVGPVDGAADFSKQRHIGENIQRDLWRSRNCSPSISSFGLLFTSNN